MRKAHLVVLLLIILVLSGCGGGGGGAPAVELTLDQKMANYAKTLRAESDWLQGNMTYLQSNSVPNDQQCAAKDFKHQPVTLDEATAQADSEAKLTVDRLNYVAGLNNSMREQWNRFCVNRARAADTAEFLRVYLGSVYPVLNEIDNTVLRRQILATETAQK